MKRACRILVALFVAALLALPLLTIASCGTASGKPATDPAAMQQRITAIARVFGDAYVRLKAAPLLQREAPHLLPIVDRDGDGVVTLAEIEGLSVEAFTDPVVATIVILAVEEAVRQR